MLLDSLKPEFRQSLCEQLARDLAEVERELSQYDRVLQGKLDESQRVVLEQLRGRRARTATVLRARLDAVRYARYHNDTDTMWRRTLQVA